MSVEEAQVVVENHSLREHLPHSQEHTAILASVADITALLGATNEAIAALSTQLAEHTGSYHVEAPVEDVEEVPEEPEEPIPEEPEEPEELPQHAHALLRRVGNHG